MVFIHPINVYLTSYLEPRSATQIGSSSNFSINLSFPTPACFLLIEMCPTFPDHVEQDVLFVLESNVLLSKHASSRKEGDEGK